MGKFYKGKARPKQVTYGLQVRNENYLSLINKVYMAGGTSGFQMVQSSKDNRSIKPNRKGMGENPYVRKGPGLEQRDPAHYPELLEERYRRKDAFRRVGLWVFFGILALMLGLMLWR